MVGRHVDENSIATAKNLIGLCYWENGFRQVTNSKRPISKLEDLQGIKLR